MRVEAHRLGGPQDGRPGVQIGDAEGSKTQALRAQLQLQLEGHAARRSLGLDGRRSGVGDPLGAWVALRRTREWALRPRMWRTSLVAIA